MIVGHFYFLTDAYYNKFNNCNLMGNKDEGDRPCLFCIQTDDLYWFVPISSQIHKYRDIYNKNKKKYKVFDGIQFGYVNGQERAFLFQNICPATSKYIAGEYMINKRTQPVVVNPDFEKHLTAIGRKYINLYKNGKHIMLTKVDYIVKELEKELNE